MLLTLDQTAISTNTRKLTCWTRQEAAVAAPSCTACCKSEQLKFTTDLLFDRDIKVQIYHGNVHSMDNKHRKSIVIKQSKGCKFVPEMNQNTTGKFVPKMHGTTMYPMYPVLECVSVEVCSKSYCVCVCVDCCSRRIGGWLRLGLTVSSWVTYAVLERVDVEVWGKSVECGLLFQMVDQRRHVERKHAAAVRRNLRFVCHSTPTFTAVNNCYTWRRKTFHKMHQKILVYFETY